MFTSNCGFVLLCIFVIYFGATAQRRCTSPDGKLGDCIPLRQCPVLLQFFTDAPKPLPQSVVNHVRKYHCGFNGNEPEVCCEYGENPTEPTKPISRFDDDITSHRNINLLPINMCGPIWTDKIILGNKTDLFEHPWMALLRYETRNGLKFLCGGSLISERYVLTAAHCVVKIPDTYRLVSVRLGEHNVDTELDCQSIDDEEICAEPVQDIPVEEIVAHPDYDKPKWSNDVAVIRLTAPANMTPETVRPICLPVTNDLLNNFVLKRVSVTGWGVTENQTTSSELLQASLPVVSNEECQTFFPRSVIIMPSQVCAGGEMGVDSCKGDSGGPLIYPATIHGTKMVQFGIVSLGIGSCRPTNHYPGIYTRVTYFVSWILDQLRP